MTISKYSIIGGVTFGMIIGLVFIFILTRTGGQTVQVAVAPSPSPTSAPVPSSPTPAPTPASIAVPNQGLSPDGTKTLSMQTALATTSGQTAYSFFVTTTGIAANPASPSGQLVFTLSVPNTISMTVPFNTWSPGGNQYVFIQEHDPTVVHYLVFKATGAQFAGGNEFLDVNSIFDQKKTGFTLGEVTGWAAPTLLVINSKKADGTAGPSYWLDVTSKAVIRLSTTFP